jgi:flavin-dependent dehydrogenase
MKSYDIAIVGAGLSGHLIALLTSRAGLRTALLEADPNRSAPQGYHVHRIDDAAWRRLVSLMPDLPGLAAAAGAPTARIGADSLEAPLGRQTRLFPDRWQLDEVFREACVAEPHIDFMTQRVRDPTYGDGLWRLGPVTCRWLIDASGGARATLRSASRHGCVEEVFTRSTHAYLSQCFEGIAWPKDRIGHAARADGIAVIARRVSDDQSRVTLQVAAADRCPASVSGMLERVKRLDSRFSRLLGEARSVGQLQRWASRRASGLGVDAERPPPHWLAVGDALLTTPPHQGQGIAQIADQATMLVDALASGRAGLASVRDRLFAHARSRLLAATLADSLGSGTGLGHALSA